MPTLRKTYYCAGAGVVRKLDNLTLPWVSVNIPNSNITLKDIKTDPTNDSKVFAVGDFNTIYVSSDSGASWVLATLNTIPNPAYTWFEVWPINTNLIVACGTDGAVAISTDGGVNFTIQAAYATPTGLAVPGNAEAVHFISPLVGVIGFEAYVMKTIDGGLSWTTLNGGLSLVSTIPGVIAQINGIHLDATGQVIIVHANSNIWRSTDGGATFLSVYSYVHTLFIGQQNIFIGTGKHLTWTTDSELWGVGDYNEITHSTNGGATWTLLRTTFSSVFNTNNAGHFYSSTDGFYSANEQLFSSANAGSTGTYSDTTGNPDFAINAVWTTGPTSCFQLQKCDPIGDEVPLIVNDDLTIYVNQVVNIDGVCYFVLPATSCLGSITLFPNGVPPLPSFVDCISCNPPKCYELTDCTAATPVIITSTDLSQYVGQTIKTCEFISSPVIQIAGTTIFCNGLEEKGFVTLVTGPTTGDYYESSTGLVKPYTNPLAFTLIPGDEVCVNPIAPFDIASTQGGVWMIQFFLGIVPITNPILVNPVMPISTLQWFIDQEIILPNTTIVVNTFDNFNFLNVTVTIQDNITETNLTVIVTPPATVPPAYPPNTTVTEQILGACICYSVVDLGPCTVGVPFTGLVNGAFPDCDCCLGPPPEEPKDPYVPTPPEIDKHTYHISESECDIQANKVFANMTYDQFKQLQYGIESCCPFDINKIWIEKELSDLSKIKC